MGEIKFPSALTKVNCEDASECHSNFMSTVDKVFLNTLKFSAVTWNRGFGWFLSLPGLMLMAKYRCWPCCVLFAFPQGSTCSVPHVDFFSHEAPGAGKNHKDVTACCDLLR